MKKSQKNLLQLHRRTLGQELQPRLLGWHTIVIAYRVRAARDSWTLIISPHIKKEIPDGIQEYICIYLYIYIRPHLVARSVERIASPLWAHTDIDIGVCVCKWL